MNTAAMNSEAKLFIKPEKVVIVEPSVSFAQALIVFLKDIGVASENIFHARKYSDAIVLIREKKPKILITEYNLDVATGISLIPLQLEYLDDGAKIAILITHDTTSSTIAEAAEEHVDAYILKPFAMNDFANRFNNLILSKMKPSEYQLKIRSGKSLLKAKQLDSAALEFQAAIGFAAKPALAHYYMGQARFLQNSHKEALTQYPPVSG